MPLYMDYHNDLRGITVEEVKNAHLLDLAAQDEHGVKYHQFWINEGAGTVFCFMEGPSKEACEAVHINAHGMGACNIVEVEAGFYSLFMGEGYKVDHGHVQNADGSTDTGYRCILVVGISALTQATNSKDFPHLKLSSAAKKLALDRVIHFYGRRVEHLADDNLLAVFQHPESALRCARQIHEEILWNQRNKGGEDWNIIFRMGLSLGQPVSEADEFFGDGIKLARRLCNLATANQVLISSEYKTHCNTREILGGANGRFVVLDELEEKFISNLFNITEAHLSDGNYSVENLSRDIGISRPQLYRKLNHLTGRSPNDFIRDVRMETAISLIKKKTSNISEVALEVGYTNPSYFARCFQKKFGLKPSEFLRSAGMA